MVQKKQTKKKPPQLQKIVMSRAQYPWSIQSLACVSSKLKLNKIKVLIIQKGQGKEVA